MMVVGSPAFSPSIHWLPLAQMIPSNPCQVTDAAVQFWSASELR